MTYEASPCRRKLPKKAPIPRGAPDFMTRPVKSGPVSRCSQAFGAEQRLPCRWRKYPQDSKIDLGAADACLHHGVTSRQGRKREIEIRDKIRLLRFPLGQSRPPREEMCKPRRPVNAAHADEMLCRISLVHPRGGCVHNSAWPMNMLSLTSATTSLLSSLPTMTMPLPPRVPFLPTLPSRWMKSMVVCGTS